MEKDAKKRVDEVTKVIVALNTPLGWGHSCPQKIMMLTFSMLFLSFIFPLFLFRFFFPFGPLSLSFSLFLCSYFLSSWFLWSALLLGFVELVSVMAKFFHCCHSCDRNSVCRLISDINHHPLLRADEVSSDVIVAGQYHLCCCWRSLNMCVIVAVV
jgi:hypothetical protein